jgi:hypothetical protein
VSLNCSKHSIKGNILPPSQRSSRKLHNVEIKYRQYIYYMLNYTKIFLENHYYYHFFPSNLQKENALYDVC